MTTSSVTRDVRPEGYSARSRCHVENARSVMQLLQPMVTVMRRLRCLIPVLLLLGCETDLVNTPKGFPMKLAFR